MTKLHEDTPENPLIWPLFGLLQAEPKAWKLNELYAQLQQKNIMGGLEGDASSQLFKVNFLLMNALYQLRQLLADTHSLVISVLDIRLLTLVEPAAAALSKVDPLADYYLDWGNYDASCEEVEALLASFWRRYKSEQGSLPGGETREQALEVLELEGDVSRVQVRQQWRRLALRWHPDRPGGDAEHFKRLCAAWQLLK